MKDAVAEAKQLIKDGFSCPLSESIAAFSETHEERSFQRTLGFVDYNVFTPQLFQQPTLDRSLPSGSGFSALPRWCKDHCQIHPQRVQLHNRMNGVLWPWDILAHLWESPNHSSFFAWVHDPPSEAQQRCQEYWDRSSHLPFYSKLKLTNPGMTVPIAWHMDGVKVFKTQKVWAYSHSSAVRKGPSIESKILFLLFRDNFMVKPHTNDCVAKLIAYVMDTLGSGVFPSVDENGKAFPANSMEARRAGTTFAGGWRAAFACFKADLEGRVLTHKLVRNWASDSICEHCLASKLPQFTYSDFTDRAAYWECMFTHEQFLLLNPPGKTSAWVNVRGWDITRNLDEPWNHSSSCWVC